MRVNDKDGNGQVQHEFEERFLEMFPLWEDWPCQENYGRAAGGGAANTSREGCTLCHGGKRAGGKHGEGTGPTSWKCGGKGDIGRDLPGCSQQEAREQFALELFITCLDILPTHSSGSSSAEFHIHPEKAKATLTLGNICELLNTTVSLRWGLALALHGLSCQRDFARTIRRSGHMTAKTGVVHRTATGAPLRAEGIRSVAGSTK